MSLAMMKHRGANDMLWLEWKASEREQKLMVGRNELVLFPKQIVTARQGAFLPDTTGV